WLTVTALPLLLKPLGTLFGSRRAHILLFGVIGFVVIGTVYHVVPFVIWVHRYSDRLGYEPVPMVDDLYSRRAARVDLVLTVVGLAVVVVSAYLSWPLGTAVGGVVSTAGYTVFVLNVVRTVQVHGSVLGFGSE
ncbi:MAG: hypothetical protein SV760_08075, partial [Halobacteria archaeon]|nr:hypothetical protein [Halobacteria archaeon]